MLTARQTDVTVCRDILLGISFFSNISYNVTGVMTSVFSACTFLVLQDNLFTNISVIYLVLRDV